MNHVRIKRVPSAQVHAATALSSQLWARQGAKRAFGLLADASGAHAVAVEGGSYALRRCSECGYGTRNSSNMARHLRSHAGHRPYACPTCDYRTSQSSHLKRHLLTHRRQEAEAEVPV